MKYQLVPMDKSHLAQVAELDKAYFSRPWSQDSWESELYNTTVSLVVAETEDGYVLGYGVLGVILDEGCLEKLAVREDNAPAIALYAKNGFAEVGRRKNYYSEVHKDAILMTREFQGGEQA